MGSKLEKAIWLPNDIIGVVMESLSARDLKQCSLVCHSWRPYAQPLLFDQVTVNVSFRIRSYNFFTVLRRRDLRAFLTSNPERGGLFKHIKCTSNIDDITSMIPVIHHCTQLRSLTLSCSLAPPLLQQIGLQNFPMLKKLTLLDAPSFEAVTQCIKSMSGAHAWEDLSLSLAKEYTARSSDIPPGQPISFPSVQAFSLYNAHRPSAAVMSELLASLHPMLMSLSRLVVQTSGFYSADILQLVEDNVTTLRSLDVAQVFDADDLLPRVLRNRVLQDIVLRLPVLPDAVAAYLASLETIFSDPQNFTAVRRASFVISSTYGLLDMGDHCDSWTRLSEFLSRFPYLEMVTLFLERSDGDWGFQSMYISVDDLDVHPAFESLRRMGRLLVANYS
ncbi:hypothetical protein D9757_001456 [Collybiopsis confluens]|uniref:F-box domain-containing protein n=1 Tax=Collybiopsis confluens TaxID=2823264 RepID=A0A8H5HZ83_9AGAR|nr:hypothetical protein D9757_001456 [Collybiopsis confluens]